MASEKTSPPLAAWSSRASAAMIDIALVFLLAGIPLVFFQSAGLVGNPNDYGLFDSQENTLIKTILLFLTWSIYAPLTMLRPGFRHGQTLGKQLAKIRTISERGPALSWWVCCLRELAKPLTLTLALFFPLPYLLGVILLIAYWLFSQTNSRQKAPHDYLLATKVVSEEYLVEEVAPGEVVEE